MKLPRAMYVFVSTYFLKFAVLMVPVACGQMPKAAPVSHDPAHSGWHFAVSGDSRNCGDLVMPSIAAKVRNESAAFYWHLGDYRAIYDFDQDIKARNPNLTILSYENSAWNDFIERQLKPFGNTPVYLGLGNHETIPPKTRSEALLQFADWYAAPGLVKQRLADDPSDHALRGYYHWIERGVDFLTLDNATADQFDSDQLNWIAALLKRDAKNPDIRTLVVGMHEALPDSLSAGHSMNESPQATESGRKVYQELVEFRKQTGKNVYVLASHSHFFMDNVYNTPCRRSHPEDVLPGWIVGTAGAVRYRLPASVEGSAQHKTDVYGYLLATVFPNGNIQFEFQEVVEDDVPEATRSDYPKDLIHACFAGNASTYVPSGPACSSN